MNTTANTRVSEDVRALLRDMAQYAPADGALVAPTAAMGFGIRAKRILAALSAQPAAQGEAVAEWQRKCPDYPNCPNLGCPCEPRETVDSIVPDDAHHAFVVGPSTHTHVRLSQKGFDLARAAFGTASAEDDARVYRTIQAYIHAALSAPEPAAQGEAVNVPGYDVGWKIRGVTAYNEAKRKGYRHPECVEAAIKAAPPAQPAERVPEGMALVPTDDDAQEQMLRVLKQGRPTGGYDGERDFYVQWLKEIFAASPAPSEGGKGMDDKCPDCLGYGENCLAGRSAHPSNWYMCETCNGTGKKQATR